MKVDVEITPTRRWVFADTSNPGFAEEPHYSRWEDIKDLLLLLCEFLPGILMFTAPGGFIGFAISVIFEWSWEIWIPIGVVCNFLFFLGLCWLEERSAKKFEKYEVPR